MKNIPTHIAIIPDGNRRWARKRGFNPWIGHKAGTGALEKVLEGALEFNIPYFTIWGGSIDNLTKRPRREVDFLFKIYKEQFLRLGKDKRTHKNEVRVNVLGRWKEFLPEGVQTIIERTIKKTENYSKYFLTFLIAYDGQDEMVNCVQRVVNLFQNKMLKPEEKASLEEKITPNLVKQNLWTKDLPLVDLVIRTGCNNDPHQSTGFMMWDTAYAQYCFSKVFFPDFSTEEFRDIIKNYTDRERRMGK